MPIFLPSHLFPYLSASDSKDRPFSKQWLCLEINSPKSLLFFTPWDMLKSLEQYGLDRVYMVTMRMPLASKFNKEDHMLSFFLSRLSSLFNNLHSKHKNKKGVMCFFTPIERPRALLSKSHGINDNNHRKPVLKREKDGSIFIVFLNNLLKQGYTCCTHRIHLRAQKIKKDLIEVTKARDLNVHSC